ncbi:SOS response-associated peptidase family protein [uncultured Psychroserpens sp.]|uniref:SOS response-associated peptidase family protein n=1 Tax=uncultured Psychroserpens sp. TaxID=255436 RepID=UPI00262209C2|nr:SOS response-associated peptidase family protein [uncultured Psychroserpens sp.]
MSNTLELKTIENELDATFRFPNLYEPKAIINGQFESNLCVLTSANPKHIDLAIWGLLPENYDDDWERFQNLTNTLNTHVEDVNLNNEIYSNALDERRCLIIVNGFFTSKLYKGKLYPHHIHLENHKPFCIAGIFNKINDGFLTCSILITKSRAEFAKIPNLGQSKPLIFKKQDYQRWLSEDNKLRDLKALINDHEGHNFLSHPIKEDFYNDSKIYERITNSEDYKSIMKIYRNY